MSGTEGLGNFKFGGNVLTLVTVSEPHFLAKRSKVKVIRDD